MTFISDPTDPDYERLTDAERQQREEMARDATLRPDEAWRHYGCGNVRGGRCMRCGARLGTRAPASRRETLCHKNAQGHT